MSKRGIGHGRSSAYPPRRVPSLVAQWRRCTALVVVFTLSLALVSMTTGVAEAANGYGTPTSFSVGFGVVESMGGCNLQGYYVANDDSATRAQVAIPDISCTTHGVGVVAPPTAEDSTLQVTLSGQIAAGGACSYTSDADHHFLSGWKASVSAIADQDGGPCIVNKACVTVHAVIHVLPDEIDTACTGVDLGDYPTVSASAECSSVQIGAPVFGTPYEVAVAGGKRWHQEISVPYQVTGSETVAIEAIPVFASNGWIITPFTHASSDPYSGDIASSTNSRMNSAINANLYQGSLAPGTSGSITSDRVISGTESTSPAPTFVGVEIAVSPPVSSLAMSTASAPWRGTPQGSSGGMMGVTQSSNCWFWFGSKIADDDAAAAAGAGATSTPAGGITTGSSGTTTPPDVTPDDPPVSDGGCDFSLGDPSTWLSGGMCSLVGLFGSLIKAVYSLPAAIFKAFADGFLSLFVPDHWPDFSDIPNPIPAGWAPSIPSVSDGSCGVLSTPALNMGPIGGHVDPRPFADTCASPWPTVRTFTYNGLLVVGLFGLAMRAYRAVLDAIGIGVEVAAMPTGREE